MKLEAWMPWYFKIIKKFGYSLEGDERAAELLSELLKGRSLATSHLEVLIRNRPVLVLGAGPSLHRNTSELMGEKLLTLTTVAADGATSAFLRLGAGFPKIIVSDLDGPMEDILKANRMGSLMVVHGHGDNVVALREYVPKLERVLGTTEIEPRPNVYNFGGFTDGDRAFFLASEMGASIIALAGMDLGEEIGPYSKAVVTDREVKLRKLRVCKELLEFGAPLVKARLFNLTGDGEKIPGFQDVSIRDFASLVKEQK